MRVPGRLLAVVAMSLLLVTGCTGSDTGKLKRSASSAATVAVPTCAHPPCGGGPGSIRWSRALPTGRWTISEYGDYRITQTPPPTRGSDNEVRPVILGAGTASTYVLSLGKDVFAFDARTGAITWSLPASRLPAHSVITSLGTVDGVVSLQVTQEFPTAAWRYHAVLLDLKSGRIQADIVGDKPGLVMATPTRAVVVNDNVLQGVDRSTGRIVWTHPLDQSHQAIIAEVHGRVLVSLPPKTGPARSLVVLDPRDGKTVETMSAPHDVDLILSRGDVLYFTGLTRAYAYDTATRKTLWRAAPAAHRDLSMQIDPGDGAAYLQGFRTKPSDTLILVRVELSGRQTAITQLDCELRAATTVQCPTVPSLTSRARGGPVGKPTTWQSPPIPEFAQLRVDGFGASAPAGPGPTYIVGVSCPTSGLGPRPGSSPSTSTAVGVAAPPARPVCDHPYLVAVNRT